MPSFYDPQTYLKGIQGAKGVLETIKNQVKEPVPPSGILEKIRSQVTLPTLPQTVPKGSMASMFGADRPTLPKTKEKTASLKSLKTPAFSMYGSGKTPIENIGKISNFKWKPPKELDMKKPDESFIKMSPTDQQKFVKVYGERGMYKDQLNVIYSRDFNKNKQEILKTAKPLRAGHKDPNDFQQAINSFKQGSIGLAMSIADRVVTKGQEWNKPAIEAMAQKVSNITFKKLLQNPEWEAPEDMGKWEDPTYYIRTIGGGLPSIAASIAVGIAAAPSGPVGQAAAMYSTFNAMVGGSTYRELMDAGVDHSDALAASNKVGHASGIIGQIPIFRLLNKLPSGQKLTGDLLSRITKKLLIRGKSAGIQGAEEGVTEGLEQLYSNEVTMDYIENRKLWDGVFESVFFGAATGGIADATMSFVQSPLYREAIQAIKEDTKGHAQISMFDGLTPEGKKRKIEPVNPPQNADRQGEVPDTMANEPELTRDSGKIGEQPGQVGGDTRGSVVPTGKRLQSDINTQAREIVKKPLNQITEDEKVILRQYEGAGGQEKSGETGRGLLDEYYTPKEVVDEMWAIAKQYGFKDGGNVLEPSVGTGRFIEQGPMANYTAAEIDETSAKIADVLTKDKGATIYNMPFEEMFVDNEGKKKTTKADYDLVIGNPPYGAHRGYYRTLDEPRIQKYEEYFIKKGLDSLKPDGTLVMIVPSGFLKTASSKSKQLIAEQGELVDAKRLPEKTFGKTSIGTDILVFKKTKGDAGAVAQRVNTMSGDSFFADNPDKIQGEVKTRLNRWKEEETYVAKRDEKQGDMKVSETLIEEAKKYKSAEEFVEAQFGRDVKFAKVDSLDVYETNINRKLVNDIKKQIQDGDFVGAMQHKEAIGKAPAIRVEDGKVIDGNHRLIALKELGIKEAPIELIGSSGKLDLTTKSQLTDIWNKAHSNKRNVSAFPSLENKKGDGLVVKVESFGKEQYLPLLESYKGKDIVMAGEDVAVWDNEGKTLFRVGLDDTKSTGQRFIEESYNTVESAKNYIDTLEGMKARKEKKTDQKGVSSRGVQETSLDIIQPKGPASQYYKSAVPYTEKELAIWAAKKPDGSIDESKVDVSNLNKYKGKYYDDFEYQSGNIYEKLDALKKENLSEAERAKQEKKLNDVLPKKKTVKELDINPIGQFSRDFKVGEETLDNMFKDYVRDLPNEAFKPSSRGEVLGYLNDDAVRTYGDKKLAFSIKQRRKVAAEKFYKTFLENIDPKVKADIEDQMNRRINSFVRPDYKKVPLMVSGLDTTFGGRGLKMPDYKLDSIGFLTNKGLGINANGVGLGKTMMAIISTVQDVQQGRYKRPLFIVPRQVYQKWITEIQELFPNQKVVGFGNLGTKYNVSRSEDIKDVIKDGDITIMTHEAIMKIGFEEETIRDLSAEISNAYDESAVQDKTERAKELESAKKEEMLGKGKAKAGIKIENLGFDNIIVDEAHNFKNIFSRAKSQEKEKAFRGRWGGLQGPSSSRGVKLWFLSQYIQKLNGGRGVKLLTATPFSNNPLEYYNMLSLMAMDEMKDMGIDNINTFMDTFVKSKHTFVVKAGGKFEMGEVIEDWQNGELLKDFIGRYIDFKDGEDYGVERPTKHVRDHRLNPTAEQLQLIDEAQELLSPKFKDQGGTLVYIDEAKKITLSPSLSRYYKGPAMNAKQFIETSPKLMAMMQMIKGNNKKTGQLIYYPLAVDSMPLVKEYLITELGYKPAQVGIVSGSTTDAQRESIKDGFNDGSIKVIIGSDAVKEGIDLQKKATDLFITSYPWRPTDITQVEGRIHRQGNDYPNVRVHFLSANDTIDPFLFQKMETKARRLANASALDQVMDVSDIDWEAAKAELIRDPRARLEVQKAQKKQKIELELSSATAEKAMIQDTLSKEKKLVEEITQSTDLLKIYKSGNMHDYYSKNLKKATQKLKDFQKKDIDIDELTARAAELEAVEKTKTEEVKTIDAEFLEKAKTLQDYRQIEPAPNDYAVFETQITEENTTFLKQVEKKTVKETESKEIAPQESQKRLDKVKADKEIVQEVKEDVQKIEEEKILEQEVEKLREEQFYSEIRDRIKENKMPVEEASETLDLLQTISAPENVIKQVEEYKKGLENSFKQDIEAEMKAVEKDFEQIEKAAVEGKLSANEVAELTATILKKNRFAFTRKGTTLEDWIDANMASKDWPSFVKNFLQMYREALEKGNKWPVRPEVRDFINKLESGIMDGVEMEEVIKRLPEHLKQPINAKRKPAPKGTKTVYPSVSSTEQNAGGRTETSNREDQAVSEGISEYEVQVNRVAENQAEHNENVLKVSEIYQYLIENESLSSKDIDKSLWLDQMKEQMLYPERYNTIREVKNPKGIKIGDEVKIESTNIRYNADGKTEEITGKKEYYTGIVTSVEKAPSAYEGGFMVHTVNPNNYGGWSAIKYVEKTGKSLKSSDTAEYSKKNAEAIDLANKEVKVEREPVKVQAVPQIDPLAYRNRIANVLVEYDNGMDQIVDTAYVEEIDLAKEEEAKEDWEDNYAEKVEEIQNKANEIGKKAKTAKGEEKAKLLKQIEELNEKEAKIENEFTEKYSSKPPAEPPTKPPASKPKKEKPERPKPQKVDLNKLDRVRVVIQDRMLPAERLQKKAGAVTEEQDIYMAEELYSGRVTDAIETFQKEKEDPIRKKIDLLTKGENQALLKGLIQDYLHLKHAPERNKAHYDGAAGIKTKEALERIKLIELHPRFQDIKLGASLIQELASSLPQFLQQNELITDETFEVLNNVYKEYVPLNRIMDDETDFVNTLGIGKGFDIRGNEVKRAVGSRRQVDDIFANVVSNWERAIMRAEKNKVGQSVYSFTMKYPELGVFEIMPAIPVHLMDKDGGDYWVRQAPKADNILSVKLQGKSKYIKINDPNLASALKNLNVDNANLFIKLLSPFTRYISMINTSLNPEFMISNFLRDIQQSTLNNVNDMGFSKSVKTSTRVFSAQKGIMDFFRGKDTEMSRLYKELKAEGGTTGFFNIRNKEDIDALLRTAEKVWSDGAIGMPMKMGKKVVEAISVMNDIVENGTRLATYQAALEMGKSKARAAQMAKNITVNFNKKGQLGATFNALYAFSNASIQGSFRTFKALKNPKTAIPIISSVVTLSLALSAWNDWYDEEDYARIPEYEKEGNWIFMYGDGEYVKIPLPWGFNVFKVAADYGYSMAKGDTSGKYGIGRTAVALINAYNPIGGSSIGQTLTPTILRPGFDIATNKSWAGYNIRPDNYTNIKESLNYFESTNDLFKSAAVMLSSATGGEGAKPGLIEMSPEDLEYIWAQYTGGVGTFLSRTQNALSNLFTGEETPINEVPFKRRVMGEVNIEKFNRNQMYDYLDRSKQEILAPEERVKLLNILKDELKDGRFEKEEAISKMKEYDRWQEDLQLVDEKAQYIKEKGLTGAKLGRFYEALQDKDFMKARGQDPFNKTQIKILKSYTGNAPASAEAKKKATEATTEKGLISAVMLYAKAFSVDADSAFVTLFTGEKLKDVRGDSVIMERMSFEKSTKIKKKLADGMVLDAIKLDHTIPLQLGGSNSEKNLRIVTTEEWESYTPVENYLGKKLNSGEIEKKEAQRLIQEFKEGIITADDIYNQ